MASLALMVLWLLIVAGAALAEHRSRRRRKRYPYHAPRRTRG